MIFSPVTNNPAIVVDEFKTKDIVEGYKKEMDIDISNYFKNITSLFLYKCPDTGMRFFHPASLAGDGKFYMKLETKAGYYTKWKWEYEIAYSLISADSKVLDIGCGTGDFLHKLKEEKKCIVQGLELNPSAFEILQKKNIPAKMQSIELYSKEHNEEYDAVCFFQVLEHIYTVKSFLDSAITCLKPGGMLIIGVPNNEPYIYSFNKYDWLNLPPHHMTWWNAESLSKLQTFFPLKIKRIIVSDFRDYNYYLKTKAINLSFNAPGKVKWFRLFRPLKKLWIQIIRNRIPGMFVMAIYQKNTAKQN